MAKSTNSGISVTGLLGVAFIVLKLTSVINWSWWWVLSPFWLPLSLAVTILVIAVLVKIMFKD